MKYLMGIAIVIGVAFGGLSTYARAPEGKRVVTTKKQNTAMRSGVLKIDTEYGEIVLPREIVLKAVGAEDCEDDEMKPMPTEDDDGAVTLGPSCACISTTEKVEIMRSDGTTYTSTIRGCSCPPGCPDGSC